MIKRYVTCDVGEGQPVLLRIQVDLLQGQISLKNANLFKICERTVKVCCDSNASLYGRIIGKRLGKRLAARIAMDGLHDILCGHIAASLKVYPNIRIFEFQGAFFDKQV